MGRKNRVAPIDNTVEDNNAPEISNHIENSSSETKDEDKSDSNNNSKTGLGHGGGQELSRPRIFAMSFFVAGGT